MRSSRRAGSRHTCSNGTAANSELRHGNFFACAICRSRTTRMKGRRSPISCSWVSSAARPPNPSSDTRSRSGERHPRTRRCLPAGRRPNRVDRGRRRRRPHDRHRPHGQDGIREAYSHLRPPQRPQGQSSAGPARSRPVDRGARRRRTGRASRRARSDPAARAAAHREKRWADSRCARLTRPGAGDGRRGRDGLPARARARRRRACRFRGRRAQARRIRART